MLRYLPRWSCSGKIAFPGKNDRPAVDGAYFTMQLCIEYKRISPFQISRQLPEYFRQIFRPSLREIHPHSMGLLRRQV